VAEILKEALTAAFVPVAETPPEEAATTPEEAATTTEEAATTAEEPATEEATAALESEMETESVGEMEGDGKLDFVFVGLGIVPDKVSELETLVVITMVPVMKL